MASSSGLETQFRETNRPTQWSRPRSKQKHLREAEQQAEQRQKKRKEISKQEDVRKAEKRQIKQKEDREINVYVMKHVFGDTAADNRQWNEDHPGFRKRIEGMKDQ